MKQKIQILICFFFLIMGGIPTAFAYDQYESMKEGETKTFYFPSEVTSRASNMYAYNCSSDHINHVEVVSYTNTSVTVKAIAFTQSRVYIRFDYWWYENSKGRNDTHNVIIDLNDNGGTNNDPNKDPRDYHIDYGNWGTITIEEGQTKTLNCQYDIPNYDKVKSIVWSDYGQIPSYDITSESTYSCTIKGRFANNGSKLYCLMKYGTSSYKAYYTINVKEPSKQTLSLTTNTPGGKVDKGHIVYLTSSASGSDIYYTLNGNTPTSNYTSSGIIINESCTLKAFAKKSGYYDSPVMTWIFTVKDEPDFSIEINEENFPDNNFRDYISSYDKNKDGGLSEKEISNVTSIIVISKDISSLKGIEHFTTLKYLFCDHNQLTSLDVSKNTALTSLHCYNNQLTSLDVSKNTALTSLTCYNNQLTSLDVSKNTALTTLYCDNNQLTSLDVSKNTALTSLACSNNQLTSLGVSKNTALTYLNCENNQLTSLGVSPNTALTSLYCDNNQLTSLDVSQNTALTSLYCDNNQLTSLDVSKNTALTTLYCQYNQLTSLDVSKNTALTSLMCYNNQLTSLDVSKNTALTFLSCHYNQLTSLSVSKSTALTTLSCGFNQLKSLDVSNNTALTTLSCHRNKLTSLNISQNSKLSRLSCYSNQLKELDISKNKELISLYICQNRITESSMDKIINNLPKNTTEEAYGFYVYNPYKNETYNCDEGNVCTKDQVAAAKAKGWNPLYYNGTEWIDYEGYQETDGNKVSLNKSKAIVRKNKTITLKATVYPENLTDKSVKWKSSDKTIATVSSSGKVTGVKSGFVTITCTSVATGAKATCEVTVGTITLNKSEVTINQGKTVTLKPTVYPTTLEDQSVKWKSSDKNIATVTSAGKVKGVKAGTATITCTSNVTGLSTTCKVTVGGVALDQSEVVVRKKKTMTLKPTVYPETLEDKSVTWESSDKTIATVSSSGKVTGVKSGVVTITCTSNATGLSATCKVTVGTITLDKSEVIVRKKKTVTLTPTVYPTTLEDKSVTWKSSDESIATVSSDGVVTGIKSGVITITCTSNATGLSTTCKVTVGTITLSKSSATIIVGKTLKLTPTVYPTTLEDQSVTWKSSKTSVATVSSTGEVKGMKAGTATITCTSNATGLSTTCKVTVTASASARTLNDENDEVTDIEIVEVTPATEEPFDVYDLRGHRVLHQVKSLDALPAGVYIVNGKKVLKK